MMNDYIEMRIKKGGEVVRIYNIGISAEGRKSFATIWRPSQNKFETIEMKNLVPLDYSFEDGSVASKSEKNKIKEELTLSHAEWTCTDGTVFNNCNDAIEYQRKLLLL